MQLIGKSILLKLFKPNLDSHKGDNGRILIIAGSEKYHGALLLAIQAASRLVDIVYVHSPENQKLVQKLKSEISVFITINKKELFKTVDLVDAVLIGPGLDENENTKHILKQILHKYSDKRIVVDATALWQLNPKWLHSNCIITPHVREFRKLFGCASNKENVLKMAKKYNCLVVLKGKYDYVSDGKQLFENRTGNVGMTKGGTGDVLAGLVTALAAKNDNLLSAQAGVYLNGLAGDKLYKKFKTFYNAGDLAENLGEVWRQLVTEQ